MTTKTYSFALNTIGMTDFDSAIATYFGYDPIVNAAETKAQFGRRNILQYVQNAYTAGSVNPAVETARETTISTLGTLT